MAWSTSDRAVQAARASGDPLLIAEATRHAATVLRRTRHRDGAQRLVLQAAHQLGTDTGLTDPRQTAMYGQLLAVAAYPAAMCDDRDTAWTLLGTAMLGVLSRRLGDRERWPGPTPTSSIGADPAEEAPPSRILPAARHFSIHTEIAWYEASRISWVASYQTLSSPVMQRNRHPGGSFLAVEETDRAIVDALTADGRLSYTDLAEKVGLSVSAAHQRVRRLEQRGVIRGYAARVAHEALGLPLAAFVAIRPLDPSQPDDAPERLAHLTEIESCYSVAGEDFYLLLVRVAAPVDLERLLQQIRTAANVTTRTTVVLSTPYENRPPSVTPGRSTAG